MHDFGLYMHENASNMHGFRLDMHDSSLTLP